MTFSSINKCKTFSVASTTNLTQLSSQECTEVDFFTTAAAGTISIYSESDTSTGFPLPSGQVYTFVGVTNSDQLSAKGTGTVYYRTKYYNGYKLATQI